MQLTNRIHSYLKRMLRPEKLAADSPAPLSLESVLERHGHTPVNTIIDVGASNGCWSQRLLPCYPNANYLLIEAQRQAHGAALETFARQHAQVQYVLAAAGNRRGVIYFDASDPFGGLAGEQPFTQHNIEVEVTTVDEEVSQRSLPGPYLLKLDTHGFEVPIFEGAAETLKHTALLIVEVYNFELTRGCLRFPQLCAYLEERGFRCLDLLEIMHRPKDNVLWQMDMVFAPASNPVFASNLYR